MTAIDELKKVCNEYFSMIETFTELSLRRNDDDARNLVTLRPQLAAKVRNIEIAVRKAQEQHQFDEKGKNLFVRFEKSLSSERQAVAHHQTKWPAPLMRDDRTGYEIDANKMYALHKENHEWRTGDFLDAIKKSIS